MGAKPFNHRVAEIGTRSFDYALTRSAQDEASFPLTAMLYRHLTSS